MQRFSKFCEGIFLLKSSFPPCTIGEKNAGIIENIFLRTFNIHDAN